MTEARETTTFGGGAPESGFPVRLMTPGTELGSRYEVRSVLGRGGTAVVYAAWDRELKRAVALKVLRADRVSEAMLKRLRREAAVARDAASPHLVRVFDIGQAGDAVFLTMELVEGESLRERVSRGPLPEEEALGITKQVLRGLSALHGLGIVHRDVKPGNVLLTPSGVAKLADFGLALDTESDETRATQTGGLLGTVEYLAPEQAVGGEVDGRADLYAVGVMLFEMVTGEVPFRRGTSIATVLAHLNEKARELRQVRPSTPRWLSEVVARLMSKDPGDRYATAEEVLAALGRRSAGRSGTRWARRRLARAGAAALVVACAAAAIVTAPWRGRTVARIASAGAVGIRALDGDGRVLWERSDVVEPGFAAVARSRGSSPPRVVALLRPYAPGGVGRDGALLSILSPSTGGVERQVRVAPAADSFFPEEPNTFSVSELRAVDVEEDGEDEVLVTMSHSTSAPSYVVLYEPGRDASRVVFGATGHHFLAGAADLDGDGVKELVLHGTANGLGWYESVAVAPLTPTPERTRRTPRADLPPVLSPDLPSAADAGDRFWFSLVGPPMQFATQRSSVRLDRARGRLFVEGPSPVSLDLDGFRTEAAAGVSAADRLRLRRRAYRALLSARLAERTEAWSEGRRHATEAAEAALAAGEPYLAEWARRVEAILTVRSGAAAEGARRFEAILGSTEVPSLVSFDAGRALHLSGHLRAAVSWYVRVASGAGFGLGRNPWEALEGAVLALVELDRLEEAREVVGRFRAAFGDEAPMTPVYSALLDLRQGKRPDPARFRILGGLDHYAYWELEARLLHGENPAALIASLDATEHPPNAVGDLRRLLRAELRMKAGVPAAEVLDAARVAWTNLRGARTHQPIARAHLDVATERFARIAAAAGREGEAAEARAFLARVRGMPEKAR